MAELSKYCVLVGSCSVLVVVIVGPSIHDVLPPPDDGGLPKLFMSRGFACKRKPRNVSFLISPESIHLSLFNPSSLPEVPF